MSAITMIAVAACMTAAFEASSAGRARAGSDGSSTTTVPADNAPAPRAAPGTSPPSGSGSATADTESGEADFPDDVRIFVASRLLFAGQLDDAATVANTVVAQRPDCDRGKFMLGLIRHKQQRYEEARPHLEAAMLSKQPFPEREHAAYFLGWCCYSMKDLTSAKHYFGIHASHWPNFDDSHFGLGVVALDEGRLADAEEALTTALRLQEQNPDDRKARSKTMARLGDVAARQERREIAITRYERAVEIWPDHHEAWSGLAKLYRSAGREEDAKRADEGERDALIRAGRDATSGAAAAKGEPDGEAAEKAPSGAEGTQSKESAPPVKAAD